MNNSIKLSEIQDFKARRDHGKVEFSDLKESISKLGLIEPLVINQNNKLLCGRRRYQALKEIGAKEAPIRIIKTTDELQEFDIALEENIKRKQLTPLEEGQAFLERKRIYEKLYPEIKKSSSEQMKAVRRGDKVSLRQDSFTKDTSEKIGVSSRTIERRIELANIVEERPELAKEKKAIRILQKYKQANFKPTQIPKGEFDVIYADPPWQYEHSATMQRDIENQYPIMNLESIRDLKIPAAKNSVLFLWATNPKLEEALQVLNSWGFSYRTNIVWVKDKIGMGYYVRAKHELILIGKRGNMDIPFEKNRPESVFISPRTTHSSKPEIVYKLIEKMYPKRTYVELFARTERKGWKSWINQ